MEIHETIGQWMATQTWPDLKSSLPYAVSYQHPYGFFVFRLKMTDFSGWGIRVHLWPPADVRTSVEDEFRIHNHGWDLVTRTIVGCIRHETYMIDANLGGEALRAYGVTSSYGAGESVLRPLEGSFSVALTAQWNAGPSDPPLYIPSGAFHASENSPTSDWESWSVTVVATENVSDNKSRVLGPISGRSEVVNPRKETLKVDEILSVIDTEDRRFTEGANKWASFVFIVSSGKILMARTYHYPEYWQPLGGQMEVSDRGPEATARREVLEELGVCLDPLKMRSLGDVPRDRGPGRVFAWLYDMDEPQSLNIQEQEIREIAWLEPADAYQRATFPATHEFLERILRMSAS